MMLAHRVSVPWDEAPRNAPRDPPITTFDRNVFDPATITLLDEAFQRAWEDLQRVQHPVTREALARCLTDLLKIEREPARLATKAVIQIIVHPANQNDGSQKSPAGAGASGSDRMGASR